MSTPSVWLLLTAIVILLAGVCVWGVLGRMDTALTAVAVAGDKGVTAYVRAEEAERIEAGARVTIGGAGGSVISVSAEPVRVDDAFTEYMRHVGGLSTGEWVCAIELDIVCAEGVHAAQIVIDSVPPMSFVLN